jgi:hypothetical protein
MPVTLTRLVLSLAAAVGLLAVSPLPAAAAAGNGVCEPGEFCVYGAMDFVSPVMDWAQGVDDRNYSDNIWPRSSQAINDTVSSVWNRSSCPVSIWRNGAFTGPGITLAPSNRLSFLGKTALGDNQASSHQSCP